MKNFVTKILYGTHQFLDDAFDQAFQTFDNTELNDIKHSNHILTYEEINKQETAKREENKMSESELLTKVITAITYLYRGDGMAPNVIVSALPNKKIYLSINRYDDAHDRFKKRIIFRTTKLSANDCLMDAVKWLVNQKKDSKNPIDELKELVNDDFNISFGQINNLDVEDYS